MDMKPVLHFFEYINKKQFHKKYIGGERWSYNYLVKYIQWWFARTKTMDEKIQTAILNYHDDTFAIIQDITKKKKGK